MRLAHFFGNAPLAAQLADYLACRLAVLAEDDLLQVGAGSGGCWGR